MEGGVRSVNMLYIKQPSFSLYTLKREFHFASSTPYAFGLSRGILNINLALKTLVINASFPTGVAYVMDEDKTLKYKSKNMLRGRKRLHFIRLTLLTNLDVLWPRKFIIDSDA